MFCFRLNLRRYSPAGASRRVPAAAAVAGAAVAGGAVAAGAAGRLTLLSRRRVVWAQTAPAVVVSAAGAYTRPLLSST